MRVGWWWMGLACAAVLGTVRPPASTAGMLADASAAPAACGTPVGGASPAAVPAGPPPPARRRIVRTDEQVWVAGTPRSETGIAWTLGGPVALQLAYTQRVSIPMRRAAGTDGVFTRLRIGF